MARDVLSAVRAADKSADVPLLLRTAAADDVPPVARAHALRAAAKLDPEAAASTAMEVANDRSEDVRLSAAQAIGRTGGLRPERREALERLLRDDSSAVRSWAADGLVRHADDEQLLRHLLQDTSWKVRAVAVKALSGRGGERAGQILRSYDEPTLHGRWARSQALRRARR